MPSLSDSLRYPEREKSREANSTHVAVKSGSLRPSQPGGSVFADLGGDRRAVLAADFLVFLETDIRESAIGLLCDLGAAFALGEGSLVHPVNHFPRGKR